MVRVQFGRCDEGILGPARRCNKNSPNLCAKTCTCTHKILLEALFTSIRCGRWRSPRCSPPWVRGLSALASCPGSQQGWREGGIRRPRGRWGLGGLAGVAATQHHEQRAGAAGDDMGGGRGRDAAGAGGEAQPDAEAGRDSEVERDRNGDVNQVQAQQQAVPGALAQPPEPADTEG